jgi:hypothetical protein
MAHLIGATAIGLAVLAGGYALACLVWPFTACPRCDGSGRRRSPSGRAWRDCRRCKGSGARLRAGRRIVNWLGRRAASR